MSIVQDQNSLLQEVNGLLDKDNIKAKSLTQQLFKNGTIITTLPTSALVDGDECYYQDSGMATDGVVWHLKYRAAATTYKWEFVGGSSLYSEVVTSQTTTSTSYVALATAGPSLALPLAGDYMVQHGALIDSSAGDFQGYMSYDIGGTAAVDADATVGVVFTGDGSDQSSRVRRKTGLTVVTLTAKYRVAAGTGRFEHRWMQATPIRVI